jgi:hypothetical protein
VANHLVQNGNDRPYWVIDTAGTIKIGAASMHTVSSWVIQFIPDTFSADVSFLGVPVGFDLSDAQATALAYQNAGLADGDVDGTTPLNFPATSTPATVYLRADLQEIFLDFATVTGSCEVRAVAGDG